MASEDAAFKSSTGGLANESSNMVSDALVHSGVTGPNTVDDDELSIMSDDDGFDGTTATTQKTSTKASVTSALSPRQQAAQHNSEDAMTIEKLKISELGLFGRDKELKTLKACFEKIVSKDIERQLVLISGVSGTGKSSLANSLMDPVRERNGLFVRGKFDLHLRHEPYSGIASACAEICGHILALQIHNPSLFEQVCGRIKEELGPELILLIQVISVLGEIIESSPNDDTTVLTATAAASSAEAKNRFQFAFQRFVRVISEQFSPFVMVLDDLHWADGASLELLDALISDRGNSGIMIIGIYRSNEVDETQAFHDLLEEFQFKVHDNIFELTELFIDDLDIEAVDQIIQTLLSMEGSDKSLALAQICLEKTHGNAFFLVHFLAMLHENGLLKHDPDTLSWSWDEEEIANNTRASANVVEMLKAKMATQPDQNIEILKAAACLGSSFEEQNLRLVCNTMAAKSDKNSLRDGLGDLERDGYIRKHLESSTASYAWAHDKIQEAAMGLISDKEGFSHRIGEILLANLDEDDLESAIFVVANLLNNGNVLDQDKRLELAKLNYEASKKAVALSAFDSAAEYAGKGIELLPKTRWTDQYYQLTLDLHSVGAQAEGYMANVEKMEKYCQEVLGQEDRPLEDKFRVYNTWIDSIMSRGKQAGAAQLLIHLLEKFRCRFPKNPVSIGLGVCTNLIRIKGSIKSLHSLEHEEMTDSTKMELMKFMDKLITCLYYEKDDRMPLVVFRSLNWTIKYGFCEQSLAAYATTAIMLTGILNDIQAGSIYGEKALELMERCQAPTSAARTMFIVNTFAFAWTKPLAQVVKPLMRAYEVGMQIGDTESSCWAVYHALMFRFIIGNPLEQLEIDVQMYANQMKDLKRDIHFKMANYIRQMILNLLGRNEDGPVTELVGEACSRKDVDQHKNDAFHFVAMCCWQGALLTYFGEHVKHADTTLEVGHDYMQKAHVGGPAIAFDTYLKGVSCLAAARQTGHRKYARMGEKMRSKIKKWQSLGNPNVKHYESILDAEHAALKGRKFDVVKHYEAAILLAAGNEIWNEAAFASERLAEYQLSVMNNKDEAANRMTQAVDYWRSWGAMAKVESLEQKHSHLLPQPAEIVAIASTDTVSSARKGSLDFLPKESSA